MGNDTRIDDLLDRWEEARENGQSVSVEALCQDCPELQDELRGKIRELAWVNDAIATRAPGEPVDKKTFKIPKVLGRYELEQLIGQGGFGQVWKAHDPQLERVVAIKILRPERQGSVFQVANFLAEAKKVAKVSSHPNIVSVYDVGEDKGFCFMVSELIDGSNLARIIKSYRISIDETLRIVAKVGEALHHGHENGIIHRDIKPHNILMDRFREPYVTDFGIAVTEAEIESDSTYAAGTPAYMAPEQAEPNASPLDRRCDIYSLGVVLYELLVGTTPYAGNTISDIRTAYRRTRPQPPKVLVANFPDALNAVCMKALELDRRRRWNTAKEFADAILEVLSPPPPPIPKQPETGTTSAFIFEEPAARTVTRNVRRSSQSNTLRLAHVIMGSSAFVVVVLLGIWFEKMSGESSVRPVVADNEGNSGRDISVVEPKSTTSSDRLASAATAAKLDDEEVLETTHSVPPTPRTGSTHIGTAQSNNETVRPFGAAEEDSAPADEQEAIAGSTTSEIRSSTRANTSLDFVADQPTSESRGESPVPPSDDRIAIDTLLAQAYQHVDSVIDADSSPGMVYDVANSQASLGEYGRAIKTLDLIYRTSSDSKDDAYNRGLQRIACIQADNHDIAGSRKTLTTLTERSQFTPLCRTYVANHKLGNHAVAAQVLAELMRRFKALQKTYTTPKERLQHELTIMHERRDLVQALLDADKTDEALVLIDEGLDASLLVNSGPLSDLAKAGHPELAERRLVYGSPVYSAATSIALAYAEKGDLQNALRLARSQQRGYSLVLALGEVASVLAENGDRVKCLSLLKEAEQIARDTDQQDERHQWLTLLMRIAAEAGQIKMAASLFDELTRSEYEYRYTGLVEIGIAQAESGDLFNARHSLDEAAILLGEKPHRGSVTSWGRKLGKGLATLGSPFNNDLTPVRQWTEDFKESWGPGLLYFDDFQTGVFVGFLDARVTDFIALNASSTQ